MDLAGLGYQPDRDVRQAFAVERQAFVEATLLAVEAGRRPERQSMIDRPAEKPG